MRDDSPSRTAAWVAAARQLGSLLPADAQLADDPYGALFSSPVLAKLIGDHKIDRIAQVPGMKTWIVYMQVRTRVIDDALREFVAAGGAQVVLLGAGYDCRALRLPELGGLRVLEVDHPATQMHKRSVLAQHAIESPSHYVAWDFEARPMDDLPDVLAEEGLDLAAPVFTIWEGVTMYLSEAAIDSSLRAIRAWSPARSRLAMTYFAKSRIAQPTLATRVLKAVVARFGEPWRFGWHPEDLPSYLEERGFHLERDIALADAARELMPPELASLVANPDRRFALAAAPEAVAVAT